MGRTDSNDGQRGRSRTEGGALYGTGSGIGFSAIRLFSFRHLHNSKTRAGMLVAANATLAPTLFASFFGMSFVTDDRMSYAGHWHGPSFGICSHCAAKREICEITGRSSRQSFDRSISPHTPVNWDQLQLLAGRCNLFNVIQTAAVDESQSVARHLANSFTLTGVCRSSDQLPPLVRLLILAEQQPLS